MDQFGTAHLLMLGLCVVGLWPAYLLGRHERRTGDLRLGRVVALAIVLVHVPTQVYDVTTGFELGVSLPLHLSDLAWVAAALALWTRHRYAVALTYFWSLLTLQALLTPSLGEDFPDVRFLAFWFIHLLVLWAAVFLVGGVRVVPGWRDYRVAVGATLLWLVVTMTFNEIAGTNYGYLQRKPSSGSLLDPLGPWPWYVVAEVAIIAGVWALMTWPWARRARPARDRGVAEVV